MGKRVFTDESLNALVGKIVEKDNALEGAIDDIHFILNGKASTSVATTSSNGLMSSADKTKLNGIAEGANAYALPVATSSALGGVKSGTDITVDSSGNVSINNNSHTHTIANITNLQTSLDGKVDLAGDTMTGTLIAPVINITHPTNAYPRLLMKCSDGTNNGKVQYSVNASNGRAYIAEWANNNSSYYESYNLPIPNTDLTANVNYNILTTKNVKISTAAPSGGSNGDIWIQYS